MRSWLFMVLFLCGSVGFAQNYADSALALYQRIELDSLEEYDKTLLDTSQRYFKVPFSDTIILKGLVNIAANCYENSIMHPFNELLGRMCQFYLAKNLAPEQVERYRRYLAYYYDMKASHLQYQSQHQAALNNRLQAKELSLQVQDTSFAIKLLERIASSFFSLGNYDQAEAQIMQAISWQKQSGDSLISLSLKSELANIYIGKKKYKDALPLLRASLQGAIENDDLAEKVRNLHALGFANYKLREFESAFDYFSQLLAIAREINHEQLQAESLHTLVDICVNLDKVSLAKQYAEEITSIAQQSSNPRFKINADFANYIYYRKIGNFETSLAHFKAYIDRRDSLRSNANNKALLKQQVQFEFKQKTALDSLQHANDIALQVAENKRRRNTAYFLWIGLALTLVFTIILLNRFRLTRKQKKTIEQANSQLKELDQAKSLFFTNISHEFRTPLTVITGIAEDMPKSETKNLLKRNAHNLLQLVNQILDLRKLEAGKLQLSLKEGDIISYLQYLVESFRSAAESKEIDLKFSSEEESFSMAFDPEKILRIISNLLSNALKFTPEGGRVELKVSQTQSPNPKLESQKDLVIRVSDTGLGIPLEKQHQIFDRFYQVNASTTREGEGTGIGLTLTKDLVELMGGNITASSQVDQGSTFHVQLPIKHATKQISKAEIPAIDSGGFHVSQVMAEQVTDGLREKLLLVEDNEDIILYLLPFLNSRYEILLARDGEEGIEKAMASVPDIIISDVMMPHKDGFELCERLKTDERTSHIPIILLTAKADIESRLIGLKRGADAYLAKPFNKKELLIRLEKLTEVRKVLQTRYQALLPPPTEDIAIQQEDAFVQKLSTCILERLGDPELNVTKLCDLMAMSRTQLHNKVKALTGRSASRFLRWVRMTEAQKLLQNPELRVADVAYAVGYNNPAYFTNMFIDEFGKRPSEVRKKP